MRKLLLIPLLLLTICVFGQNKGPVIAIEETNYDFGEIDGASGTVKHTFKFNNTGTTPLVVQNIHTGCNCSTAQWTKTPIAPGGSGEINLTLDPNRLSGKVEKLLRVYSNSVAGSATIKYSAIVKPNKYPTKLGSISAYSNTVQFGNITKGQTAIKDIAFMNNTDQDITLKYSSIPKHMKVKTTPEVIKPGGEGVITVIFDSKLINQWDYVNTNIRFSASNNPNQYMYLYARAVIKEDFSKLSAEEKANAPAITVAEKEFKYGTVKQNDIITHIFKFKNEGKSDLLIRNCKASCGCTTPQWPKTPIKPGESGEIKVVFNTRGKRGTQTKTITIISNDPIHPTLILYLRGTITVPETK